MLILIILLAIVSTVAAISIKINVTLYKHYTSYELNNESLHEFFTSFRDKASEHYAFFDKACKMNLLMNDPIVMEIIGRLKETRKDFADYLRSIEESKKQ